ncbi:MAG: GGDEF domain-containing protein [Xanthomonadales bacterium]|nr:GGDEF domain-containing protein [Xanthomonadales bacterium]
MTLDTHTLMVVGMLLCGSVATLLAVTLPRVPAADRRSLKVWTVGLALQPLAWTLFSVRGNHPDVMLSVVANLLLILGFAQLACAVRIFLGVPERRALLHGIACAAAGVIGLAAALLHNFSALVMLNAVGVSLVLLLMLGPLLGNLRRAGPPEWLLVAFSLIGTLILGARFVEHWLRPQIGGGFLEPSLPDSIAVAYAAFGPVIVSFAFMLMHQERAHTRLEQLATTDGLTGLLNRRAFEEAARQRIAEATQAREPLGLLLLDLDHFKQINDLHGHQIGDRALQHAGAQLRRMLGAGELAARVGGEELALLLRSPPAVALQRAEALRRAFEQTALPLDGKPSVPLRTSIGVASLQPGRVELDALMRAADQALYAAKAAGRNRVGCADADLHARQLGSG